MLSEKESSYFFSPAAATEVTEVKPERVVSTEMGYQNNDIYGAKDALDLSKIHKTAKYKRHKSANTYQARPKN